MILAFLRMLLLQECKQRGQTLLRAWDTLVSGSMAV